MSATETRPAVDDRPRFEGAWETTTFGDEFVLLRTASNSRADLESSGSAAYVHYGDIHTLWNTYLDFQNDSVPRIDASKVGNATELCDGDLLLADASEDLDGVGKAVEVINISGLAFSGLHTIACRPRSERIAPGFSGLCCDFPSVKTHFRRVANGLKVFGLSKASLRDTPLPLPGPDEQRAIAAALSDADDLLQSLDRLIAKKRDVKHGVMQQLLTGTTRLPGFEGAWERTTVRNLMVRYFCGPSPTCEERNISTSQEWGGDEDDLRDVR